MRTPEEILGDLLHEPDCTEPQSWGEEPCNCDFVFRALRAMQRETLEAAAKVAETIGYDRSAFRVSMDTTFEIAAAIRNLAAGEAQHG